MLQKRNHTYYFRWKLPADLAKIFGQNELSRSLFTADKATAICRASFLASKSKQIKLLRNQFKMGSMPEDDYKKLVLELWNTTTSEDSLKLTYEVARDRDHQEAESTINSLVNGFSRLINDMSLLAYERVDTYEKTINENRLKLFLSLNSYTIDANSDEYKKLLAEQANAYLTLLLQCQNKFSPTSIRPNIPDYIQLNPYILKILSNLSCSTSNISNDSEIKILLSEAWKKYTHEMTDNIAGKWKDLPEKQLRHQELCFRDFLWCLQEDMLACNFKRDNAKEIRRQFLKLPANREKLYAGKSPNEIPDNYKISSTTTSGNKLTNIKTFFEWLFNENYIQKNPFSDQTIEQNKIPYATYEIEHLQDLFQLKQNKSKLIWRYWIPRIALYTGARQNEIAQLTKKDVIKDDKTDIYYFNITDDEPWQTVKNHNANRKVPISQTLIENGFIAYHSNLTDSDRLWPDLKMKGGKYGQTVSDWWQNFSTLKPTKEGNRFVFHSIRKRTISSLLNNSPKLEERIIQELVGHEPAILNETNTYFSGTELPTLKEYVDYLSFNIEWIPANFWIEPRAKNTYISNIP